MTFAFFQYVEPALGVFLLLIMIFAVIIRIEDKNRKRKVQRLELYNGFKKGFHFMEKSGNTGIGFLIFLAALVNLPGKYKIPEAKMVLRFMMKLYNLPVEEINKLFFEILKQPVEIDKTAHIFSKTATYEEKLHLIYLLYRIAAFDKIIRKNEDDLINYIASAIKVESKDVDRIRAMFIVEEEKQRVFSRAKTSKYSVAFRILGIKPDASEENIKDAYRQLAKLHHPDMVAHLGESFRLAAEEKFRQIVLAYEIVCKKRGIN